MTSFPATPTAPQFPDLTQVPTPVLLQRLASIQAEMDLLEALRDAGATQITVDSWLMAG